MTNIFKAALLVIGGVTLVVLVWFVVNQRQASQTQTANVSLSEQYDHESYSLRHPQDWRQTEIATSIETSNDLPRPVHHFSFSRQTVRENMTVNDCTLEVRIYEGPARPDLTAWAKKILGVENPAFGGETSFADAVLDGTNGIKEAAGKDMFIENDNKIFYLILGDRIAEAISAEAGQTCRATLEAMLDSFNLK